MFDTLLFTVRNDETHKKHVVLILKLGQSYKQFQHMNHRRKRFLNKPIFRPDDKDNTTRCNTCDDENGSCDMVCI